jgi:hypothetical protein
MSGCDNASGADNQQERLVITCDVEVAMTRILRDYTPSCPLDPGQMR